jgi:phosphoglycolate phosphatase
VIGGVRLLIFDWDGTLSDSAAGIVRSMQDAIAELNLPPRDDASIRELIGLGFADGMNRLYPEFELQALLGLLENYRRRFVHQGLGEAPLFPGALEALGALHADGFRLSVATGKSRPGLNRSLRHHTDLARLLSSTRTADETACKPDPLMLKELLWHEGLEPEQALMIGDTEYDAAMARAIGMPMLGVSCGVHAGGRILGAGAIAMIDSVRDLPAWLAGRSG